MKKFMVAVIAVLMMASLAYGQEKMNFLRAGLLADPATRVQALQMQQKQQEANIAALKANKEQYTDNRISAMDDQISKLENQIAMMKSQRKIMADSKTTYADSQLALMEKQLDLTKAQIADAKKLVPSN